MVVSNGTINHSEIHFPRSYSTINGEHLLKRKIYCKHWCGGKRKRDVSDSDDAWIYVTVTSNPRDKMYLGEPR